MWMRLGERQNIKKMGKPMKFHIEIYITMINESANMRLEKKKEKIVKETNVLKQQKKRYMKAIQKKIQHQHRVECGCSINRKQRTTLSHSRLLTYDENFMFSPRPLDTYSNAIHNMCEEELPLFVMCGMK